MQLDDRALVDACLAGDDSAWNELVERYGRLVYSIPRRLGLSDADADDVFQVVFGIVLRRLETLREVDRLSAWLIRATYREAWRIAKRRSTGQALPDAIEDEATPHSEQVERWEQQQFVREGLRKLDDRCRTLLEALFFEVPSPSYEEVAGRLGVRIGSIGPTRARCFQKLETILRALGL